MVIDAMVHELRTGSSDLRPGSSIGAAFAYAFARSSGHVVEPAVRVERIDLDSDRDEAGVLTGEGSNSGLFVDVGLNYYISGNNNKLQLSLSSFQPEAGSGDALVLRLQHQLSL